MPSLPATLRTFLAVGPVEIRKGFDGLARLCQETLGQDPWTGVVFVFRNRKATAVKLLLYDGQGFWLCQKKYASDCPHSCCFTGSG